MLRRSQIASRSLCSSSCSGLSKKTCVLPPTSSAKPESLRGAIASPNPPSGPFVPLLSPSHQSTSLGAGLRGRSTSSTFHPSFFCTQSLPPCLLHGKLRPATAERDGEIARS